MIDLHCHSNCSDGKLSPEQLVKYAYECGIKVLALTDHDTVSGVTTADLAAKTVGIQLIPGVELSVSWRNVIVHVVAVQIDIHHPSLQSTLKHHEQLRASRAIKIGELLAQVGITHAYEGAKQLAGSGNITRAHFAQYLVEHQHARNIKSAFKRYLGRGKVAYVATPWLTLEEAIPLINNSGGRAILAHPLRYGLSMTKLKELLVLFKQCGGSSIEVISGMQNISEINQLASLCQAYDLLASVGSDFHGVGLTNIKMGTLARLPANCTPVWHGWSLDFNLASGV